MVEQGTDKTLAVSAASSQAWGTPMSIAKANAGIRFITTGAGQYTPDQEPNESLCGSRSRQPMIQGLIRTENVPLVTYLEYDTNIHALIAACLGAMTTPSLVDGTAYTSTYAMTAEVNEMLTLIMSAVVDGVNCPNGIIEHPTIKIEEMTLTMNEGAWQVAFTFHADTMDLNSSVNTSMASVTCQGVEVIAERSHAVFRMNAESGIALASGDAFIVQGFELTVKNNMIYEGGSGSDAAIEPFSDGFRAVSGTITLSRTADYTQLAKIINEELQKMDVTLTGPAITGGNGEVYSMTMNFPKMKFLTDDMPVDGPGLIGQTIAFECNESSQPAGMLAINDEMNLVVVNTNQDLYF